MYIAYYSLLLWLVMDPVQTHHNLFNCIALNFPHPKQISMSQPLLTAKDGIYQLIWSNHGENTQVAMRTTASDHPQILFHYSTGETWELWAWNSPQALSQIAGSEDQSREADGETQWDLLWGCHWTGPQRSDASAADRWMDQGVLRNPWTLGKGIKRQFKA